ncbi:hypothetical protein [Nitrosomonas sp. Nm58]|uniref:hypothetical protein n=1 Tax=Nitrosomonas sp. Nm58 TaxID=200126 RepID=UPI00115FE8A1|nr:hypothetical protein [Nitrosomonas sp. Nm58]
MAKTHMGHDFPDATFASPFFGLKAQPANLASAYQKFQVAPLTSFTAFTLFFQPRHGECRSIASGA